MTSSNRTDACPWPLESDDLSDLRVVHLSGELDMLTAPYLWEDVRRQLADASCGVALELSELTFLGVGCLKIPTTCAVPPPNSARCSC